MSTVERLKQRLMEYFVSVGRAGRVVGGRVHEELARAAEFDKVIINANLEQAVRELEALIQPRFTH